MTLETYILCLKALMERHGGQLEVVYEDTDKPVTEPEFYEDKNEQVIVI